MTIAVVIVTDCATVKPPLSLNTVAIGTGKKLVHIAILVKRRYWETGSIGTKGAIIGRRREVVFLVVTHNTSYSYILTIALLSTPVLLNLPSNSILL